MNATPSAPCSTSRRVDAWMGCPGTVKSLIRSETSPSLRAERERQQVEEERAVVLRLERHQPPARVGAGAARGARLRLVVFPLSAGP